MTTQLSDRIDQLTRSARAVRAGDRRTRPGAQLGARRRPGDRARRRLHRGVRRRAVRGRLGAHGCPRRPRDRRGRAAAGAARRVPTATPSPDARGEHRGQPVPVRRSVGDLPRAAAAVAGALPRRRVPDRRGGGGAGADAGVRGRPGRPRGRSRPALSRRSCPATAATRPAPSGQRSTPASASSAWCAATPAARRCSRSWTCPRTSCAGSTPTSGLDIGARTAPEIALSIVAAIVRSIRLEGLIAAPVGRAGGRVRGRPSTRSAA